jgi:integrase
LLSYAEKRRTILTAPRLSLYEEHGRERVITPEEEKALMAHASPILKDVLLVMIDCGLRRKETARLRIEHIDWQSQTLFIPVSKTKQSRRRVPMSKRVFDALFIRVGAKKDGWMFPGKKKDTHVGPDSLSRAFARARVSAEIPKGVVLYSARHTYGTDVYAATGNLKVVMAAMGHTDVKTAMRYQHPELGSAREAIDKRNEVIQ